MVLYKITGGPQGGQTFHKVGRGPSGPPLKTATGYNSIKGLSGQLSVKLMMVIITDGTN